MSTERPVGTASQASAAFSLQANVLHRGLGAGTHENEGALYLLKLSNGSLRPRRRQRQCGSSSCDDDSDAAALDTHAELSQDGACKKQSDARNLSMHKRAKGSLTAQGCAIGGSLANSISARLALASRHSPLGSALTKAGREA
ncbi:hypothetical protein HaLaN_25552, partial [Haematococcus lacustris]